MYKYGKIVIALSTAAWLTSIALAFRGFVHWYEGFVVFYWIALATLNYKNKTSLWLLRCNFLSFFKFFLILCGILFFVDLFGQAMQLWIYRFYKSTFDWVSLYLILYPFAALCVLETFYLVSRWSGKKPVFIKKPQRRIHKTLDKLEVGLMALISLSLVLGILWNDLLYREVVVWFFIVWILASSIKIKFHLAYG